MQLEMHVISVVCQDINVSSIIDDNMSYGRCCEIALSPLCSKQRTLASMLLLYIAYLVNSANDVYFHIT